MLDRNNQDSLRDVLLLGGGHTHALLLRRWVECRPLGARVTLVTESPRLIYSGMLPGHVAGDYARQEIEIDLEALAAAAGARLVIGKVQHIEPTRREVTVAGTSLLHYDFCSLNLGGTPDITAMPAGTVPVKPPAEFLAEISRIDSLSQHERRQVVIIGGGVGGAEVALALARRFGERVDLTIIGRAPEIAPTLPPAARAYLTTLLKARGVRLTLGHTAEITATAVDHVLGVTGVTAPSWLAKTGLALDAQGFVRVNAELQSVSHPEVFAVGDISVIEQQPRARAGVFAVRQAEPLAYNLAAAIAMRPLNAYSPQKTFLSLINTGKHEALAIKGRFVTHGRSLHILKDRIDRAFMAKFQGLGPKRSEHVAPVS